MEKTSNVTIALEHSLLRSLALGATPILSPEDVVNVDWNNALFNPAVRHAVSTLLLTAITKGVTGGDPNDPLTEPVTVLANSLASAAIIHMHSAKL